MRDTTAETLFRWLDRGFWAIWAAFPVLIWVVVSETLAGPERLAELVPEQAACIADMPNINTVSVMARWAFWGSVVADFAIYALLLALAHVVIHRCGNGQLFFEGMVRVLRWIGLIIATLPVLDLVMANLTNWAMFAGGDVAQFQPGLALDLPTFGVGLLLVAIAYAMRQAVALRRDAELTI